MQDADCILCRVPGEPVFEKADESPPGERFGVVRCAACGLAWVSLHPSPHEIGRYYPVETGTNLRSGLRFALAEPSRRVKILRITRDGREPETIRGIPDNMVRRNA